jgi:hypothetical protein
MLRNGTSEHYALSFQLLSGVLRYSTPVSQKVPCYKLFSGDVTFLEVGCCTPFQQ